MDEKGRPAVVAGLTPFLRPARLYRASTVPNPNPHSLNSYKILRSPSFRPICNLLRFTHCSFTVESRHFVRFLYFLFARSLLACPSSWFFLRSTRACLARSLPPSAARSPACPRPSLLSGRPPSTDLSTPPPFSHGLRRKDVRRGRARTGETNVRTLATARLAAVLC